MAAILIFFMIFFLLRDFIRLCSFSLMNVVVNSNNIIKYKHFFSANLMSLLAMMEPAFQSTKDVIYIKTVVRTQMKWIVRY